MLRILTYNILAQEYYHDPKYTWNDRKQRILDIIINDAPDIICLQEIDIVNFVNDFNALYENYTTVIMHEQTKKRTNPIGNIILCKKDLHTAIQPFKVGSCSVSATIDETILVNLHLRAGRTRGKKERICQIKSILKMLTADKVILCGDFNDDFKDTETASLFNEFTINNTKPTMYTFIHEKHTNDCLDNVLTKNVKVALEPIDDITGKAIPDDEHPSDHIPIIFEYSTKSELSQMVSTNSLETE